MVQSSATALRHAPVKGKFRVCVIGHLREEKDPLRTLACPANSSPKRFLSRWFISAQPLDPALVPRTKDRRYRWLGSVPHARALRWLASSHAMVISSRMEGGANVVCEALRIGVPVLASRIPGNVGLLGAGYGGYFRVEDERALGRPAHARGDRPGVLPALEEPDRQAAADGRAASRGHAPCSRR